MEVDRERRDLLGETEQVDGRVEERGSKLGLEVDRSTAVKSRREEDNISEAQETDRERSERYALLGVLGEDGHVEQGGDVDRKLEEDREEDVEVEDVAKRSLAGQLLHRLRMTKEG